MNSFTTWRVSVASPETKATIESYLLNNAGAVRVETAVEFITPLLDPWDDVSIVGDDGRTIYLGLDG